MAPSLGLVRRNYTFLYPPRPAKSDTAIRIGLLGASNIAPPAIINAAKSHPEVIIAAVAARDENRAKAYAKKYGIPIVHSSYQALLDDPSITAIYNPLPNGLHYEWTLKALQAGKHVLLEKPSVSNSHEAELLFHHPLLSQPNAPVLLEAFHSRFHPAWQKFLTLIDRKIISTAHMSGICPKYVFPATDIRFQYDIGGGAMMDMGTYGCMFLRGLFGEEPEECIDAKPRRMEEEYDQKCDDAFEASWRWKNGAIGTVSVDLRYEVGFGVPGIKLPTVEVTHKEVIRPVGEGDASGGENEHIVVRKVTMWNSIMPVIWHRIDVIDAHCIRNIESKKTIKSWAEKEQIKAYTWDEGTGHKGEEWWSTYRHQLEAFVDRIKGRQGSGVWMDGEDSIKQMHMIDSAYMRAGMALRPTSQFRLNTA